MELSEIQIAWLAGVIEGEGSFLYTEGESPTISIQMTDKDIVERVAVIFEAHIAGPYVKMECRPTWTCRIYGQKAVDWMRRLNPHMGVRRRAKIADIVQRWVNYTPPARAKRFNGTPFKREKSAPTCGHSDRLPATRNGKCQTCYMREWRSQNKRAPRKLNFDGTNGVLTLQ